MKLNKNIIAASALTLMLALPLLASAITFTGQPTIDASTNDVKNIVNATLNVVWWVFTGIVVIFFIIIAILFLSSQGNPEAVATARRALIWGGVGVIVGVLAFGIIRIITNTLGGITLPTV